jgi:hypothetical protein
MQELSLQLDLWLQYIPRSISQQMASASFDFSSSNNWDHHISTEYPDNLIEQLKGRYWATKFAIYRPYVFKTLHSPPDKLTHLEYGSMLQCLEAGLNVAIGMGLLTSNPRLVTTPFGPIRKYV